MRSAFVGFIYGVESEDRSVSDGEMVVYSDDELSTSETESLYQLQDARLGGYSNGDSIPDPYEPPSRVAIFMAGTQLVQNSSTKQQWFPGQQRRWRPGQEALCARRLRSCPTYWTP